MRATIGRAVHALLLGLALLAAPASADELEPAPDPLFEETSEEEYQTELGASVPDPIEPLNRKFFAFNDQLDQRLLVPLTNAYQFVLPSPVRVSIRRVFRNLQSPVHFVNSLLQLRFEDAAHTLGAFALNTTAGIGGLFDAGAEAGLHQRPADFGQTLGLYGVQSGPYLVIPVLGPSTMRDGFGDLVDRAFDPLTYLLGMGNLVVLGGSSGFVTREASAEAIEALRGSSVDYYAAMRSAFTQNRESKIAELRAQSFWIEKPAEPVAAE